MITVWKSKNGLWEIVHYPHRPHEFGVVNNDRGRTDWYTKYSDGRIANDGIYRLPNYVKDKLFKLFSNIK